MKSDVNQGDSSSRTFTRRQHRKSRGGCSTCKLRRKKCDETHPACLACAKSGWKCDGYEKTVVIQKRDENEVSNALAVTTKRAALNPRQNDLFTTSLLNLKPQQWALESSSELTFISFFVLNTVPQLSSCYDSSFWSSFLPMSCYDDLEVRQAAIALGAMHQATEYGNATPGVLETAFKAYGRTLRLLRERLQTGAQLERAIVITSLLAAFELFQDNSSAASLHLAHGLNAVFSLKLQATENIFEEDVQKLNEFTLEWLTSKIRVALELMFEPVSVNSHEAAKSKFDTLEEAYKSLLSITSRQTADFIANPRHIDYACYSKRLTNWDRAFIDFKTSDHNGNRTKNRHARLLRMLHEAVSLQLLLRVNYCGEVDDRSTLSRPKRYDNLDAYYSRLCNATLTLLSDSNTPTHLSSGQLRRFGQKSGLLHHSWEEKSPALVGSRKVFAVANTMAAIEGEIALASSFVPANAISADVITTLEDGKVGLRYCIRDSEGLLRWTQKTAKL